MQNNPLKTIKQITRRAIVRTLPKNISDLVFSLKHRNTWRTDTQSHLKYNEEYTTREPLITAIKKLMEDTNCRNPKIIEFGCSGANNLRLIKNLLPNHTYCGIDINESAINFARQQFPNDTFHVCDDSEFPRLIPQLGHYDVFLAITVLYYIKPSKAQEILTHAAHMADYVLVCDDLSCFDRPASENDGLFLHSFSAMCRTAELEIITGPIRSDDPRNRHSYFIARSSARAASTNVSY